MGQQSTIRRCLLLGLFLVLAIAGRAAHFYVDSSATAGANNGTSWANAYRNLQTAINVVPATDTLWVAKGHYYPGIAGDNIAWFDLKVGQVILGGFSGLQGIQETSASQRNFVTNATILSGDLDKNGVHSAPDAYHVVNSAGKDSLTVVDGFTIEMGYAVGTGGHSLGAGIFSFGGGGSFYNCIIQNNYSNDRGAGAHAIGNFKFMRCIFRNNQSATVGGAISQSNNSVKIKIHNCAFIDNVAVQGAALYSEATDFQLFNSTFKGNSASVGAAILTLSTTMVVKNCIIWGNPGPDIQGNVPVVTRCIVEGGYSGGTNILNVDPQYSDALGRIKACSPAVDAGDTIAVIAQDYDGFARPFDGDGNGTAKWDLGAYEVQVVRAFPPSNPIVGPNPACANSFNNLYRVTTDNTPANTYQWTLASGGSIASGATNDSVRVNWGPTLGSYALSVLETNVLTGCSTNNSTTISLNAVPSVSLSPAPFDSICTGDSVLVTATGAGVSRQWYRNGLALPGATGTSIQASQAGYYNCIVTGANGCGDSAATSLRLHLRPLPTVNFTTSVPTPICQGDVVTITGTAGVSHQWYRNGAVIPGATTNAHATGLAGLYNLFMTDMHGCRDSAAAPYSLVVNPLPVVTLNPAGSDTICIGDSLAITANASNPVSYQWYRNGVLIPGATANPIQAQSTGVFNCRLTNNNGCRDSAAVGFRLTSDDFINPVAACRNLSVHLNTGGTATLTPPMLDNGSTDNCRIASYALSSGTMTCANLGANNIVLTVTDFAGRTSTCTSVVTVIDSVRPTAVCNSATVYLGTNGQLVLSPSVVGSGSTDNCAITLATVTPNNYVCADTGAHVVTYTAQDASGNTRSCTATIMLEDSTRPNALCRTATIYLDGGGNASITPAAVNNGSTDNCGIATVGVSRTNFNCADVPGVFVTLSLTDVSGNLATCAAYVRVVDSVAPVPQCRDTTVYINFSGISNLTPAHLNDGSNDNCTIDSVWISQSSFTCLDTGLNVVTLSVIDADTNLSTCISNVTVLDTIAPQAVCTDTTFYLNASGIATVNPAVFGINSVDNCTFFDTAYVDLGTFNCAQTGVHVVELFVVDVNGRVDSCTGNVTILDNMPPAAACNNLAPILSPGGTVSITAAQVNNGSTDNCGIASMGLSQTNFTCANVGPNNVTLSVTDVFGNVGTCVSVVTVTDTVAPVAQCQPLSVALSGAGTVSITPAQVNNGSSDNCAIGNLSLNVSSFGCAQVGANAVVLTVTDTYGNARTCTSTVTVADTTQPIAACRNATVYLNASGSYTLTPAEVDNGGTDNCGIANRTLSQSAFTCGQVGANTVTLTFIDPSGLSTSCTATVTVLDSIDPTAVCSSDTFYLSPAGNLTLTVADVAGASFDNCAINGSSLSQSAFDCGDLGANGVTVTLTDPSGNVSTCSVTVTIRDTVAPQAACNNVTLALDGAGTASLTTGQVDNGSSDACGIAGISLSTTSFLCADLGSNAVTLSVTDSSGNVGTCISTVTVEDTLAPMANCGTATVNLDANGQYLLLGSLLSGGSTDVCGIDTAWAVPSTFDCNDIGNNTVQVFVQDPAGNQDTCTATFTLQDATAPVADCDSVLLQLQGNGVALLTPATLGPNSSDNCGIDSAWVSQDTFTCSSTGWIAVTLTLRDSSGNQSNCTGHAMVVDTTGASAISVNLGPDTTACNGEVLLLNAGPGQSDYLWSTGATTQTISVSTAGTYWVQVGNALGCTGSDTITVSTFVMPAADLRSESGNNVVCLNDTLRLLVNPVFTSYLWSTGSTTSFTDVTTGGNYSVLLEDANGCQAVQTISIQFSPFPGPNPVINPGGNVGMCENTSLQLDAGAGYFSYLWSTNQTSQAITAFVPGTYSVQVWNGFGCHATSDDVVVFSIPSPYPDINRNLDTLFTTTLGTTYQWYIGNVAILGATNRRYVASVNGNYRVRVYYTNGCTEISSPLSFVVGVEEEQQALDAMSVFPNPSNGQMRISLGSPILRPLTLRVTDLYGRSLHERSFRHLHGEVQLDLRDLAAGMYLLELKTGDATTVRRIVIE